MPAVEIQRGLSMLESTDLVLGPAADGGYWAIGVRQPIPGLLRDISWSTDRTLAETEARARRAGLRVAHLASWTDVDRPEDLPVLASQIAALRAAGDLRVARLSEAALRAFGLVDDELRWRG